MKKKHFNINTRMLVYLLTGAGLLYLISLSIFVIQIISISKDATYKNVEKIAQENANLVKSNIDEDFKAVETLAYAGSTFELETFNSWKDIYMTQQQAILEKNEHYISVATSFELKYIDSAYTKDHGRLLEGYYRENEIIKKFVAKKDLQSHNKETDYYLIKTRRFNWISNPEMYSYTGKDEDAVLNTNMSVPIIKNDKYVGLAGADIDMSFFQEITQNIKPYPESYAFVLSFDGSVVTHPNQEWIGQSIAEIDSAFAAYGNLLENIEQGGIFNFNYNDTIYKTDYHYTFVPIVIKKSAINWTLAIAMPESIITEKRNELIRLGGVVGIVGVIIMAILITFIARSISRPIKKTTTILKELAKGKINKNNLLQIKTNDELGDMANSVNYLINGLHRTTEFASAVGQGDLEVDFEKLSKEDVLGEALLEMRDNLKKAQEEEARRKKEEDIRRWAADGYSNLNDMLRQSKDLKEMTYSILSTIIKYIDGAMGALYILNDNDENDIYFEMMTAVAYEREKLIRHKVKPEEGLVGRCAHEQLTIHLREIPEGYVTINSGLGESDPRSLVLIPLKANEKVLGVMEFVSFNLFKDYEIEFLEKAGESIASEISTTKISQRTETLLKQSQDQAESLAQQEEEMRQNMEEIQATQESLKESQAKTQMIFDNVVDAIVTTDSNGIIELWNPAAEVLFGYSLKEAVGQNIKIIMYGDDAREHDTYLKRYMETGQRHVIGKTREVMGMHKSGKKFPVELRIEQGQLGNETKFVGVLRDITDKRKVEEEMDQRIDQLKEINRKAEAGKKEMQSLINGVKEVSLYVEYNMDRKIIDISNNFLRLLDTKKEDMLGVKQGAFETDPEKQKEFDKLWSDLAKGKTRKIVQHVLANGKNLYFSEVYIPIKDDQGNISKVINLAIDITDTIRK